MVKILQWLTSLLEGRAVKLLLYFCFFWIVASATFSGFIGKYAMMDDFPVDWRIEKIIDGSAPRPFIYRQLLPWSAKFIEKEIGTKTIEKLTMPTARMVEATYTKPKLQERSPTYKSIWVIIYYLSFFSLFLSLILIYNLLKCNGFTSNVALLSTAIFSLSLPYLQTPGGYYYDFSELFFMSLVLFLAVKSSLHLYFLLPIAVIGAFNKETFFLFLLCIYPFMRDIYSRKKSLAYLGLAVSLALIVNLLLKNAYADNPGGGVQFHLFTNITHYLDPHWYFIRTWTYGTPSTGNGHIIVIIIAAFLILRGYRQLKRNFQVYSIIATVISLPLFLLFCATGELRNWSFLYIPFILLIASALTPAKLLK